ncbi:FxLD family lanthipeptide [Protofrankia symbiont of Coriaria ruscifolia]|uniref:FxLD family lanthipeptide n=1 Tax=Protofrankia symbiont of Coriaria ruscifolia TaxID=1306542 RepID=UPI00104101D8|nr:FxLD family lanthipeptide [Protofrankia symbiont of Coriaria ruscifolia]
MSPRTAAAAPDITTDSVEDGLDFHLDITVVESGPVIPELLRITSDNCGKTCQSACTSCRS